MITIYRSNESGIETLDQPRSGCWINVADPSPEEIGKVQQAMNVPQDFITYPLDMGETPRTEKESGATLIILRVPYFQGETSDIPYATVPLGIILTDRYVATVCKFEVNVIQEMVSGRVRGLLTAKRYRFILQLLLMTANRFLNNLRAINKTVDELEDRLQSSLRNRELVEILKYQKSLVYFTTALKANELMINHLQREQLFQLYPEDQDLLEDVHTEVQQAIEMTNISSSILSQMMGAFAAIISNNLNVVLKFLAAITIVVSLPTMIASFFGMNVVLPLQNHPLAFSLVVIVAVAVSVFVIFVLWKKDWL